jgi:hypothetical protein
MSLLSRIATGAVLASSAGCRYDIDKIFGHQGALLDGGLEDAGAPLPAHLIALWKGQRFSSVDAACEACAQKNCAKANQSCRNDADCAAFTACIAESTDPANQDACRASSLDWVSADIDGRDIGGPYQQCVFKTQCAAECGGQTNWQCVGHFSSTITTEDSLTFRLRFKEALTGRLMKGMSVKVCRPDDLYCSMPQGKAKVTDDKGEVELNLATPLGMFTGYFELSGAKVYPTLLRFGWPLVEAGATSVNVIDTDTLATNVAISRVTPDPERGMMQLRAQNCDGLPARGVTFHTSGSDDSTLYWYTTDSDPIPDFKATATESLGAGGVLNVPEGRQTITGTVNGKVVAETTAPVRKGFMSIVVLAPQPRQ